VWIQGPECSNSSGLSLKKSLAILFYNLPKLFFGLNLTVKVIK
jgi:hypothetical protein